MGIITDNETIENDVEEVKVSTTASGLYVKNGKGNYVIVNMVGELFLRVSSLAMSNTSALRICRTVFI